MDLWIRSQDKETLLKVDYLYIPFSRDREHFGIHTKIGVRDEYLGIYKSKERALEVLDEIQKLLMPVITYTQKEPIKSDLGQGIYQIKQDVDLKIQQVSTYVYEMPIE